jgi:hypothetical protein
MADEKKKKYVLDDEPDAAEVQKAKDSATEPAGEFKKKNDYELSLEGESDSE